MKKTLIPLMLLAVCTIGCRRANPSIVAREIVPIDASNGDAAMQQLIEPYRQAQELEMGIVIGESALLLSPELPEGLLNAFVSDAMFKYGNSVKKTDMAITNFGGLRNDLPQGALTIGHVCQVMPFDNAVVFIELSGTEMRHLADAIAAKGGDVETGMSLTIRNGKAENVLINGKPIDDNRTYRIITTDYLSYGNDYLEPLANHLTIEPLQVMLRDLLVDDIRRETESGNVICPTLKHQIHVEK